MYNTLIFDLDDTLTDDTENVKQAFKIMLEYKKENYTDEKFFRFRNIDLQTWKDRNDGKLISPYENNREKKVEWLRASRFIKFFGESSISYEKAVELNNVYMAGMKEIVIPKEGCLDTLKYLCEKGYRIVIATNGPLVPLKSKIEKLYIDKYISVIFSAEEIGFMKPDERFYIALFQKANIHSKEDVLFIGDDLEKDVKGANSFNIDVCWCNYNNQKNSEYKLNYEINKLEELKIIL